MKEAGAGGRRGARRVALVLLAVSPLATAVEDSSCLDAVADQGIDWEFIAFAESADLTLGALNPGNLIAALPEQRERLDVRPDFKVECSSLTLALSPRLMVERQQVESALPPPDSDDEETDSDVFINSALLRWDIGSMWTVEFNRQALLWGPSLFFSPSNPFTRANGRNTPYEELPGEDFLIVRAYIGSAGVLSFYNNFAQGEVETIAERFEHTYALAYEHTAYAWTATVLYSQRNSEQTLGGFGQYTLNDSIVLFTDLALIDPDENRLAEAFPLAAHSGILDLEEDWTAAVTLGGSYSFLDGSNVSAEYFYNGSGLTDIHMEHLLETGNRISTQIETTQISPEFAHDLGEVGQVVSAHVTALRQHYVAMQYNRNDIADRLDLVLRWTYGATDGGSLAVADFNCAVGDNGRVFLTLLGTFGDAEAEFRQFYDYRATLGASLAF